MGDGILLGLIEREGMRMKNKQVIFILMLMLGMLMGKDAFAYKTIRFYGVDDRSIIADENLEEQIEFEDYKVFIYREKDGWSGVVQIFKGDEIVFEEQGHKYYTYAEAYVSDDYKIEMGTDLTGDGEPNLAFVQWSGGAHCCFDTYIFSIGNEFRFISKFFGEHGTPVFEDVNVDGDYEVLLNDWAFAYWNASFAGSPAPEIILSYNGRGYEVAYDLMKKPLTSSKTYYEEDQDADWKRNICQMGNAWLREDYCITSDVWAHMLELIYGGHPEDSWDFLDEIWGSTEDNKQAFIADFKEQLAISDYAESLRVDLDGFRSDIDDESEKSRLRFNTYYEKVMTFMDEKKSRRKGIKPLPTLDSLSFDRKLPSILKGWSGL